MTEFFKLIGLKLEADWLELLDKHGFKLTRIMFREDNPSDHTCYYHQDEYETGGASYSSFIYLWIKGQRRITICFEEGVLTEINVSTNSKVTI